MSSWSRVRFGDVVVNVNDYYSPDRDGVLPYVAGPNIVGGQLTVTSYGSTDDDDFPPTFKRKFRSSDVLLHSRGIEKLAAVDRPGVTGEKLFVLRSMDESRLLQRFLPWLLMGSLAQRHMRDNFTGSVNKFLNWRPLADFEFDLPSIEEQDRIAGTLWAAQGAWSAVCAERQAAAVALQLTRRALVDDERIPSVPANHAFNFSAGVRRTPDRAVGSNMTSYLRSANVGYGTLDLSDVQQMNYSDKERLNFSLLRGDVLVTEGSASANAVGMPARWLDELPYPVCFQMTLIRLRAIEGVSVAGFAFHWAMYAYESGAFLNVAGGTNIKHVSVRRSSQLPVRLPDLAVQRARAERLDAMTVAVDTLRAEEARLVKLRDSLAATMLGGTNGAV
jgi:restriction endonuclease S subunit